MGRGAGRVRGMMWDMASSDDPGPVIRTPDQRLRVFVSSTLAELAEERAGVRRAIESLGLAPVMFELGARPHPPQELYRAYLEQSDIFVGLYWQSYGWVGPGMDVSGLEDEFQLSGGKPRLLYLKAPAPDREARLEGMIDQIRSAGSDAYRSFRSTRELGRLVRDDLALLLSERFTSSAARSHAEPAAPTPRRTLPVMTTSLVGRDADVAEILSLLQRPDVRLLTISGPGGMGKTRVAVAVGEALAAPGAHRVVFVPLASATDAADVLPRIASAADIIVEGTRSTADILVERFTERPAVLILDNLEQLTAAAPALDDLLSRCPGLKMLVTSRVALRLRVEYEYVLPPLASGSAAVDDDPLALTTVQLFLDRASAVGRRIDPSPQNLAAMAEIGRRLDGLPLAIELAAARTRLLEPAALLSRLENVLDALGSGPVDLPERQRSLRATVEWSVGLLGEQERRFLATVSTFVDGWTLPAAAHVGGLDEDETFDLLDTLVGNSLVTSDIDAAEPRFRMLGAVREYAAQLSSGDERGQNRRRHAEFFEAIAEVEVGSDEKVAWSERLRADEENLRASIRWLFDNDPARLPHLLRSLWLYWQVHDRMSEARALAGEAQRRIRPADLDAHSATELLFTVAVTSTEVGDDEASLTAIDEILLVVDDVDDPSLRDSLLLAVSWIRPLRGEIEESLSAAYEAYRGFAARQDVLQGAAALTIGMLRMAQGDETEARRRLSEVDSIGGRFDIQWLSAAAATHLAIMDVSAGDRGAARTRLRRLLAGLDTGRTATLSACLILAAFGDLSVAEGEPATAATALGAMDGLRRRAGVMPWPNSRAGEDALRSRVRSSLSDDEWDAAYARGASLRMPAALEFVRHGVA